MACRDKGLREFISPELISYDEAIALIYHLARTRRNNEEEIPLEKSLGRVVAKDYNSLQNLPAFANSSMDGFAVISEQTLDASPDQPLRLPVLGSILAGDEVPNEGDSQRLGVWEIMTGASIPNEFDSIVKVEDVEVIRDSHGDICEVVLDSPVLLGQNCREPGEDFKVGTLILKAGTWIMPEHILALAALGYARVQVVRKPKVVIISTGSELVGVGQAPKSGQIQNSTAPFLLSVLDQMGSDASFLGTVTDDPSAFFEVMKKAMDSSPDLILTTGGVSMGKHDFVKSALRDLGAVIHFHKILMRPGKPNLLAEFEGGPIVFGLPGNPVSTVVGIRFLVEPFLRSWMGRPQEQPWRAQLQDDLEKPQGLRCFFKSRIEILNGRLSVQVLSGQASFMIRPLLEANAWAVISEDKTELAKGTWIDVFPLHSSLNKPSYELLGENIYSHSKGCC